RRSRATGRRDIDRQRQVARAVAGAGSTHQDPGADAALRSGADRGGAAKARADSRRGAGNALGAPATARLSAHGRAGARGRSVAGGPGGRRGDPQAQTRGGAVAEADAAADEPPGAATRRARTLGIVRTASGPGAAVRTR